MSATNNTKNEQSTAKLTRFWEARPRWPYLLATSATYAAVILAILPPIFDPRLRSLSSYDPTVGVLTATLIALIWTAYHTFQGVQHARSLLEREDAQRERDARFYLEALAEEITQISHALKMVENSPRLARFDYLSHPMLVECMKRSDLFAPSTAVYMTRVASALRPLPGILQAYRQDPKDPAFHKTVIEIIKRTDSTLSGLATNLIDVLEGGGPFAVKGVLDEDVNEPKAREPSSDVVAIKDPESLPAPTRPDSQPN